MNGVFELNDAVSWLQAHQDWLALMIGAIAFMESLAIVGLVLPGVVMLFAAASLAGGGALDVWTMLFAGFVGALLGDWLSFVIGQVFHHRIRNWWPFRAHPQLLAQGERFFDRHGGISIALGRFVGPIRPVIPVVAGMMGMPARYFYLVNALSALLWAPAYLLPGYFVGASLHWQKHLPDEWLFVIGILLVVAVVASYCCRLILDQIVNYKQFLAISLLGMLGALAFMTFFALMSLSAGMDEAVLHWSQSLRTQLLDRFFLELTWVGDFIPSFAAVLLGLYWLVSDFSASDRRGFQPVWFFLLLAGGLKFSIDLLKAGIGIIRPSLATAPTFAYPSGHTAYTIFIGVWLGWYLSRYLSVRFKPWLWSLGLFLGLLVGVSRIYLAEHWLSDVLGGIPLGLAAFLLWLIYEHRNPVPVNREKFVWRVSQLITVTGFVWIVKIYLG